MDGGGTLLLFTRTRLHTKCELFQQRAAIMQWQLSETENTLRLCGDGKEVFASRSGARGVGNNIRLVLKINQSLSRILRNTNRPQMGERLFM